MRIDSEEDFCLLDVKLNEWKKRFPMFVHDVANFQKIIETHKTNYSKHLVMYRQTHRKNFLELAEKEIEEINRIILVIEKIELMAMLSQR